ncbi:hypothetical protein LSTR_LSTR012804 [Laodelphax striatellus]|uniref:MD-2-related lipid-recognition domain-containing protein n=1 Tax=Laodelphax striatellus TaxID=195883 RepID=A0A482WT58_LAOST|nr:hypothetical protein LSTR_LSTR012804 [Laodelphax striatellus]
MNLSCCKSRLLVFVSTVIIILNSFLDIAEGVAFTDCGSGTGTVLDVHLQDCVMHENKLCYIDTQNKTFVRFGIHFITEIGMYDTVTSVGTARKWGLHTQVFSKLDICNDSLSCPLQPDKHFYSDDVPLPSWVPKGEANVQWKLSSGSNEILCVEVDVNVL